MPSAGFKHAERVTQSVRHGLARADAVVAGDDRLFQSWKRSLESYQLDPGRSAQPRILTSTELKDHQDAMEAFLRIARHGVRMLHQQVRDANYVVLLTNGEGVTLDFLGDSTLDRELKHAGLYLGSCWSEQEEGTCGVGTAIIDGSPITVHKGEHFRAPNTSLTCSAAPVMDASGRLLAILDASALNSPDDKKSQILVLQFVQQCALMIEDAYFLNRFGDELVIQLSASREFLEVQTEYLVAVSDAGQIIGANRKAKRDMLGEQALPIALEQALDIRMEDVLWAAERGLMLPVREAITGRIYHAQMRPARRRGAVAYRPVADVGGFSAATQQIDQAFTSSPLAASERDRIVAALRLHRWQVSAAARELGVSRATLYRHMERLGILSPNKLDL